MIMSYFYCLYLLPQHFCALRQFPSLLIIISLLNIIYTYHLRYVYKCNIEYEYSSALQKSLNTLASIFGAGASRKLRGALCARAWIRARRGANYAFYYLSLDSCMQRSWNWRKPYTKFSWHNVGVDAAVVAVVEEDEAEIKEEHTQYETKFNALIKSVYILVQILF